MGERDAVSVLCRRQRREKKKTSRALHLLVPPNVPNGVIKGDVQDKRRSNRNPQ